MRVGWLSSVVALLLATAVGAQEPPAQESSPIEDLGDGQYRIGEILIDKPARRFTAPGRIIHLNETLEYVAVSRGGMKEYESLLELDSTAIEFQLACILIGLDAAGAVKPRYQFDEREVTGQRLDLGIRWERDGKEHTIPAADALLAGEEVFGDDRWVYIGSRTQPDGTFLAEMIGTVVGFVHDPDAIIDHQTGGGIGAYGLITGNDEVLPPEGAPVTLVVAVHDDEGGEEQTAEGE